MLSLMMTIPLQPVDPIVKQICGGEYGFPEDHAYSFALLAYVSLWMKYCEPAIFQCQV